MFIILFGLLGVAALLEVGRSESSVASRQDRATACGVAGLAEMRARGLIDPRRWVGWYDQAPYTDTAIYPYWAKQYVAGVPTLIAPTAPWAYNLGPGQTAAWRNVGSVEGNAFGACVIDPSYILQNISASSTQAEVVANVARFPYTAGVPTGMRRLFLDVSDAQGVPLTLNVSTLAALADREFIWPDDQIFNVPNDPLERPFRAPGVAQNEMNYSWMVTVVGNGGSYEVSLVVFYQRDFTPPAAPAEPEKPGERTFAYTDSSGVVQPGVAFFGAGWGGGDVRLAVDSVNSAVLGPAKTPEYLDVRQNDWILLYGVYGGQSVLRWYRVAGVVGDVTLLDPLQSPSNTNPWTRSVTLDGPDWIYGNAYGVLCTGVVGVYRQ